MTKTVYLFNELTKEYAGTYEAYESPKEPGEFIVPTCSALTPPPSLSANQVAVKNSGKGWSIKPDHRGYAGYDSNGLLHEITNINIEPDASWTLDPPAPAPQPKTQYTSLEILARFTQSEQESIASATLTNMPLKLFYDKLLAATFVDVTSPVTIGGVDALIATGLLASNRRDAILLQEQIN